MRSDLEEMVSEVFCDVVETMAFMFGEVMPKEELPRTASEFFQTSMSFSREKEGTISLTVPEDMCTVVTANVLGLDPEDERVAEQPCDALKELLNVTCGRILTEMAGTEPIFDLSVPDVKKVGLAEWDTLLKDPETIGILVDDYPVLLRFELKAE